MLLAMCLAAACAWGICFVFGGPSSPLEEFPRRSQEPIVAPLYQNPEFPSGCEAFSLAMCLRSMGYSGEPSALIDTYMPTDPTWSDFVNHFAGDARSSGSAMPPAVVACVDAYATAVDAPLHGVELTGCSFDEIAAVVERGYPVLTWITTDFESPRFSTTGARLPPVSELPLRIALSCPRWGCLRRRPAHRSRRARRALIPNSVGGLWQPRDGSIGIVEASLRRDAWRPVGAQGYTPNASSAQAEGHLMWPSCEQDCSSRRGVSLGTHRSSSSLFMRSARNSIHHAHHSPYRVQWTMTFKCVRDTTRTIKRGARARYICLPVMLARQAVGHYFF